MIENFIHDQNMISVIVPVYNVECYLRKCVDSILNQTFKNLEIILINDGSTDSSGSICDEYAQKDSRIKVIHKENGGLSSARNAGLDIAQGEFIAFVDSDDWIDSSTYKTAVDYLLQDSSVDIVKFGVYSVFTRDDGQEFFDLEFPPYPNILKINATNFLKKLYLDHGLLTMVWNALYRRQLIGGCRFLEGAYHEDEMFTINLLSANPLCKIINIPAPLYLYRRGRANAITSNVTRKHVNDIFDHLIPIGLKLQKQKSSLAPIVNSYICHIYISKYELFSNPSFEPLVAIEWLKPYRQDLSQLKINIDIRWLDFYLFVKSPKLYMKVAPLYQSILRKLKVCNYYR